MEKWTKQFLHPLQRMLQALRKKLGAGDGANIISFFLGMVMQHIGLLK
jgi:hypothetical protein